MLLGSVTKANARDSKCEAQSIAEPFGQRPRVCEYCTYSSLNFCSPAFTRSTRSGVSGWARD